MEMKIGHIEVFVKEPLKAKDFYVDILGFEVVEVQGDNIVWLKLHDSLILLRPGENKLQAKNYQSVNNALVLYTENLDSTVAELKSRGLEFKGTDGSDKCLTFTDIDGNWFQLVNPEEH
jgi:catechol 2,3-dioxygenase-like lactoylglutathione lyase family enzyme